MTTKYDIYNEISDAIGDILSEHWDGDDYEVVTERIYDREVPLDTGRKLSVIVSPPIVLGVNIDPPSLLTFSYGYGVQFILRAPASEIEGFDAISNMVESLAHRLANVLACDDINFDIEWRSMPDFVVCEVSIVVT